MKIALVLMLSLLGSVASFAEGLPPRVLGMPVLQPCQDAQADAAAKAAASKFDAFYRSASAYRAAPVPADRASIVSVGTCNTGSLLHLAGVIINGVIVDRPACGVNYTFVSVAEQQAFAKWAYMSLAQGKISIGAVPLCANLARFVRPVMGMPVRR